MDTFLRSNESWPTAKNSEIVNCWHNDTNVEMPKDWYFIADRLRSKVKNRKVKNGIGIIDHQIIIEDLAEEIFPLNNKKYHVYLSIEQLDNGEKMKHAIVKQPEDIQLKELLDVLRLISLVIESDEPSLFCGVKLGMNVFFWHLVWPFDWDPVDLWFSRTKYVPLHREPILILKERSEISNLINYEIKSASDFDNKILNYKLLEYKKVLVRNHSLLIDPLIYLDQQTAIDLTMLQMGCLPSNLGKVFPAFVYAFIEDRLGECNGCGKIICKHFNKDDIVEDFINSKEKCRQFLNASIWPLNKKIQFGRFRYKCSQCGYESFFDKWMKLLDPVIFYPKEVQAFMMPFFNFLNLTNKFE